MHAILAGLSRDHPALRKLQRQILTRHGYQSAEIVSLDQAAARCRTDNASLAVLLLDGPAGPVLENVRRVREAWAGDLLVVGPATDPKLILRCLQAGADLFLDEADLGPELDAALARVQARRGVPGAPGRLVAVLSPSGGCGASTLAVNLAALLAAARGSCNLIDLNLGKADLGPLLDLKPPYTIADLCRNEDRLDRTLYDKLLTAHESGVSLLSAPRHFDDLSAVTATGIARAVEIARQAFADVVVDLENCVHEEQLGVVQQATTVLLVCRLDFTAVRNTRRAIDHLALRGVPGDRIEVVVNQFGQRHELPVSEAEAAFAGKRTRFVPHDPEIVGWANNTGIPAAVSHPQSEVVQAVARLVGLETKAAPRRGWLARLIGRRRAEPAPNRTRTYSEPVLRIDPPTAETIANHDPAADTARTAPDSRPVAV